jgi:hypothetical protein
MLNVIEAIKKIYPEINGGFVYWETKQDGFPWDNPFDGLVWENTQFKKPTWEQIEAQFTNIKLEQAKAMRVTTRITYLKETDWQAAALIKYGRPIDDGVATKCQLAVDEMDAINACGTIEEVKEYLINF